jgi:phage-related protein
MLMPYAIQLLGWVREGIAWFNALDPSIQRNILIVLGLVAVLGPLLIVIGSVVGAIGTLIPIFTAIAGAIGAVSAPVLIVVGVIIAALALLYAAWTNNWGGIREKTAAIWEGIKSAIATAWQFIQNAIEAAMTVIGPLMQAFQAAREGDWRAFGEKLREAWDAAWTLIRTIASTAWENLKLGFGKLIESVVSFFRDTDWGQVGRNIIEGIANGIRKSTSWIIDAAKYAAKAALDAAKGFLGIHSESKVFKQQVGWEMGAGQVSGYEESLKKLMPVTMDTILPGAPAFAGLGAVSAETGRGGAGGVQIVVPIEYKPFVSTADEREARTRLTPIIIDVIREYLNR